MIGPGLCQTLRRIDFRTFQTKVKQKITTPNFWPIFVVVFVTIMAPLVLSSTFARTNKRLSTTKLPDNAYVLSIASLQGHYAAASSVPSNAIHLYDKSDCKTIVHSLPGHVEGVTYMRTVDTFAGGREVLLSCGKDGNVKAWDERSGTVATQSKSRNLQIPSCAY